MLNHHLLVDGPILDCASGIAYGDPRLDPGSLTPLLHLHLDHTHLLGHLLVEDYLLLKLIFKNLDPILKGPLLCDEFELSVMRLKFLLPQEFHNSLH
jgi:hypothetical protein